MGDPIASALKGDGLIMHSWLIYTYITILYLYKNFELKRGFVAVINCKSMPVK